MAMMKNEDLKFAHRFSLAQRDISIAKLLLENADEHMNDCVHGFERMERFLAAQELQHQERLQAPQSRQIEPPQPVPQPFTYRNGNGHANNGVTSEPETAPIPKARKQHQLDMSPEAQERRKMAAQWARDVRMSRLNGTPMPKKPKELLTKSTKPTSGRIGRPPKLIPLNAKSQQTPGMDGMFPYPFFVKSYMTQHPGKQFNAYDIVQFAESLGYAAKLGSVRGALQHQAMEGAIVNMNPKRGIGNPGLYKAGKIEIKGIQDIKRGRKKKVA